LTIEGFSLYLILKKEVPLTSYEVFPNAPITEAVLDIQCKLPEKVTLEDLKQLHKGLKNRFPEVREQRLFERSFKFGPDLRESSTQEKIIGYHFKSPQEQKLIQYRLNGYSFNKLAPYKDWPSLKSEANEFWRLYYKRVKPLKVTRIALRYINRIKIPLPMKNLNEYLLTLPKIAPNLPQEIKTFLMRIEIQDTEIPAIAIIVQAMEKTTQSGKLPIILDIDVVQENDYYKNISDIWDVFEKIRNFKNDIFFETTTDKAKELFR
jgi:uncharacterized protein (TIGR04255 family)